MKTRSFGKPFIWLVATAMSLPSAFSQQTKSETDTTKVSVPKSTAASNMMLNASADNGPRVVNIGLPASVGGTTILENGLPVVYDFQGQMPTTLWRQDASIAKFNTLNVSQTALQASDVGVSVSTYTNKGSEMFKGTAGFSTNSFGLLRGEIAVSGPLKNNFYYSLSGYLNLDPGTYRSNVSTFMDDMKLFRGVINKKYGMGEIGLQYKFAYNEAINAKQSPYIYHSDGKVTPLQGFRIGRDAYVEQSGKLPIIDPLTGEQRVLDAMKDLSSTTHAVDLLGNHRFWNDLELDYTVRYQYAKAGLYNPYLGGISQGLNHSDNPDPDAKGQRRYYYADSKLPYNGLVQNSMMIAAPSTVKNTVMARFELGKKTNRHQWMVGLHNWFYKVNDAYMATYDHVFEVAPNPKALLTEEYNPATGSWEMKSDEYGNRNYNKAYQYYNGVDNKLALVATEKWTVNDKLNVEAGTRLEWHRLDGDWHPYVDQQDASKGRTQDKVKKDKFNKTFTGNILYKAFPNFGFLADVYYIEQSNKLSSYAGADFPGDATSVIPGYSIGVYFNHPMVSLVSKFTQIKRTNFINNSTFNKEGYATVKQTNSYDVSTIGWTTDAMLTPFKGFTLHLLLTLQNPSYKNYAFSVFGQDYDFSGNVARSVSKTLIEIDPSYSFGKFRLWASARYFSKEYANYPNTLVFAQRWETFAGLNFKYDKNVDFSISAVNLLNEKGAQGSISGTNLTTAEEAKAFDGKALTGTYIRPFTVEFKTKIRF